MKYLCSRLMGLKKHADKIDEFKGITFHWIKLGLYMLKMPKLKVP